MLPVEASLFLGRRVGDCFYYFDRRHRARCYANIKIALGQELSCKEIARITKDFYQSFGQSIVEVFLIPKVDRGYMDKHVEIEGKEHVFNALGKGKGVILLSVHAGSWELSSIFCANFGVPFVLFVRGQHLPRLNALLNRYRQERGCKIITREGGLKQLVESIKNNAAVGITLDQGGKSGVLADFFGRSASMSVGGLKLALKYGCSVIPVYFTRVHGPKIKLLIGRPLELTKSNDPEKDLKANLDMSVKVFEDYIRKYPKEYLWTYKIWKYSAERAILILSDGKLGHLHQSEAAAKIVIKYFSDRGIRASLNIVEVKLKNKLTKLVLSLSVFLAGKYDCQGCLWCLRKFLPEPAYKALTVLKPDVIISCGSTMAGINLVISRQNQSRSIALMRPGFLGISRFDMVIMPKHDHPAKKKNIVITNGALNLIDEKYLSKQSDRLVKACNLDPQSNYLGVLIGGNSKKFILDKEAMARLIREVKTAAEIINADLLLTTSRRTSKEVEALIKDELKDYARCKLMVIANERNLEEAVGGILGLSKILIVSPESISMVSESVNSLKPVVVFDMPGLSRKHRDFLNNLADEKYIYLSLKENLVRTINDIWIEKPQANILDDNNVVEKALERII
jgi:KDO2-lipid IV(A) lauroyltransferase